MQRVFCSNVHRLFERSKVKWNCIGESWCYSFTIVSALLLHWCNRLILCFIVKHIFNFSCLYITFFSCRAEGRISWSATVDSKLTSAACCYKSLLYISYEAARPLQLFRDCFVCWTSILPHFTQKCFGVHLSTFHWGQ